MVEARERLAWRGERVLRGTVKDIRPTIAWVLGRLPARNDATLLDLGLTEALTNAVAHGVNGLDGAERDTDYRAWLDRLAAAPGRDGGLRVALRVEPQALEVHLRWLGTPYGESAREPTELDEDAVKGRGALLIASAFEEVEVGPDGLGLRLRASL